MQESSIKLHDIKPLMDIQDYSLLYFVALVIVVITIVFGLGYLLVHYFQTKKRYDQRKDYVQKILALDIKDSKKTAYALSHYGALFVNDSTRHKEMYENLTQRLAPYKYKKEVEPFDEEVVGYIELYKGMLDV
jgi:hypothetical protein